MYVSKRVIVAIGYWLTVFILWFAIDLQNRKVGVLLLATAPWSQLLLVVFYPVLLVLQKGGTAMVVLYFILIPVLSGGLNAAIIGLMVRVRGGRWPVGFRAPVDVRKDSTTR
jgi:hypothetical protein